MGWNLRVQPLEMSILIGSNWVGSSLSETMVIWLLPFSVFLKQFMIYIYILSWKTETFLSSGYNFNVF